MEGMLKPLHFAADWLGEVDAKDLQDEIVSEMDVFWASIETELPETTHGALRAAKDALAQEIRNIPLQNLQDENRELQSKLRARLPQSYAQLDEIPAKDVVSYVFSCLDDAEQTEIQQQFPPGFWSKPEDRKDGALAGFAFMLFFMGIVRDGRVRRKERKRREKHFLGQFRDCLHIEEASRCAVFLTFDVGAARLAKAVYSYAGVATHVWRLAVKTP